MNEWPNASAGPFGCACRFVRRVDFGPTELVESCGYHATGSAYAIALREALEAYLAAKPQCECTDPGCRMEAARILARAALAKNPNPIGPTSDAAPLVQPGATRTRALFILRLRGRSGWDPTIPG